jgi:hypothetical protein
MNNELKLNGANKDPRSPEEISKDFKHVELFGFGVSEWVEKPESTWKNFPIRNQNGSGMCGAFAGAKELGANNVKEYGFKNLDTRYIYNLRKNKTSPGMYMNDLFDILTNRGAPEDATLVSDGLTEEQGNLYQYTDALNEEAKKFKGSSYIYTRPGNVDDVNVAINNGYFPIILLRCNIAEWTSEPKVIPTMTRANYDVNHFVCVVDTTLYNGKKCLIIEDSWGSSYGRNGRRILSEDFVDQRVEQIGYVIDWKALPAFPKPAKYQFNKILKRGMNNRDVSALQDVLKYEGCMVPTQVSTGFYGSITANAVKKLWKKYAIATQAEIDSLQGNQVGPKTLAWLNNN